MTSGSINPPGTYLPMNAPGTTPTFRLLPSYPINTFLAQPPCTNSASTIYTVSTTTGIGDTASGCPDQVPAVPLLDRLAYRINCENGVNPGTGVGSGNLQTFLMIYVNTQPPGNAAVRNQGTRASDLARQASSPVPVPALQEQIRQLLNGGQRQ